MTKIAIILVLILLILISCQEYEMETVSKVDLEKFMGDWYVIAFIPNLIEKKAINGIESYERISEDEIRINYTFSRGKLGNKVKRLKAKAFIHNTKTNAEWRVQFFWPFKFPYLIIDLAADYNYTVIGVPNRKYVWIMSRDTFIEDNLYQQILAKLKNIGYDITKIKKMPQNWR